MRPGEVRLKSRRCFIRAIRREAPLNFSCAPTGSLLMKTRQVLGAGAILALVSLVVVMLRHDDVAESARSPASQKSPAPNPAQPKPLESRTANSPVNDLIIPTRDQVEGQPALVAPHLSELTTTESPALADKIGSPNTPPEQEAKVVLDLLKLYRRLFGTYPAGENNHQFVNALLGANKEKLPLLPHNHPRLNAQGELVDAWGTPFFFHQNSRNSVEVRSAGADRLMYTSDDILAGRPSPTGDSSAAPGDMATDG